MNELDPYENLQKLSLNIFKRYFLVSMPEYQSKTSSELRARYENTDGSYSGHISDRTTKHLCIEAIAVGIEKGNEIRMEKPKERIRVYNYIQDYLVAWEDYSDHSEGHMSKDQLDHIKTIDALAHHLYDILGKAITKDHKESIFNGEGPVTGGANRNSLFDGKEDEPAPSRIKFSAIFGIDETQDRTF